MPEVPSRIVGTLKMALDAQRIDAVEHVSNLIYVSRLILRPNLA